MVDEHGVYVDVSVIICVRNGASTIRRQLDALDRQVDAPRFEIIVVNNRSTDDTAEVVRGWIEARKAPTVTARIINADERAHIPFARNRGALAASGQVLAYCDADDEVDEGWVGALARCMTRPGVVGGRIDAYTPDGLGSPTTFADGLTHTHYLPHAGNSNLAVSRDCFIAIGGYDESLPRYGYEDVDLCWRAQEQGYAIGYCRDAVVRFSISPKRAAIRKQFLLAKGRVVIARRHPRAYEPFTLALSLRTLLIRAFQLPYRLVRPGQYARSRHVAWLINSTGHVAGWWTYEFRGRSARPQLLSAEDFV